MSFYNSDIGKSAVVPGSCYLPYLYISGHSDCGGIRAWYVHSIRSSRAIRFVGTVTISLVHGNNYLHLQYTCTRSGSWSTVYMW